jgi:hypothetical protein
MKTSQMPFDSDALRANIDKTAQQVVVPERYLPLLDAVQGFYGVRAPLAETLGEYFHSFRNNDAIIEGFQTILLRNWSYFERAENRGELFGLLTELVLKLMEGPLTVEQSSLLLRQILTWCTAALNGPHGDAYDDSIRLIGEALSRQVPERPVALLERDVLLRNLVTCAAGRPALAPVFFALYRPVLLLGYRLARERLDIIDWATAQGAELTEPAAVAERFDFLSRKRLSALIRKAGSAPDERLLAPDLPAFSDLLERLIDQVFKVENLEDRFAVCLYLLKDDTLG